MKLKLLLCIGAVFLLTFNVLAQHRYVSTSVGYYTPTERGRYEGDVFTSINYAQFDYYGFGYNVGFQWVNSVVSVGSSFGIPVYLVYTTRKLNPKERINQALYSVGDNAITNAAFNGSTSLFVSFLFALFSNMEFFVGMTPGYAAGTSTARYRSYFSSSSQEYWRNEWMEKNLPVSLTVLILEVV